MGQCGTTFGQYGPLLEYGSRRVICQHGPLVITVSICYFKHILVNRSKSGSKGFFKRSAQDSSGSVGPLVGQ